MKVAIYARYSSDMQSDASIEDQIRQCEERAKRESWAVYNCYTDHALSGASLMRPGVQMLLQDAMAGKFDIILTEALDRLSRDQEDIAGIYKRMQFVDVKILTLSEGEVSNLHIGLKGTMNAMFLKDLADKTRRGLRGRVEKGKSGGGLTYGYDVVKTTNANGDPVTGERTINPEQAAIVNRIFRDFAGGKSPKKIAFELNKEGISGPSGKGWGASTIYGNRQRGTGIINNELYIGRMIWNRLRYIKDPDTGKRVSRLNPQEEWIIKDVPELRIVEQELWDSVKDKQGAIKEQHTEFWGKQRPPNLFSFLLKCGCCHGGFSKISKTHYGCSTARNKGTCDNRLGIHQEKMEQAVLTALKKHLMDSDLCAIFCEEYTAHLNALGSQKRQTQTGYKNELEQLEKNRQRIVQAVMDGFATQELKVELDKIVERRSELERLLEKTEETPVLLHPNMADHYRREVEQLIESLNEPNHRSRAADLLRTVIEKIVLTPNKDSTKLEIDLYGDLAGILSIASKHDKHLKVNENLVQQVKMVAGSGFEPATFRL